ncbi:glycoside hydrolase family 116 protein [Acidobacteria bacterium AH-259-O06]|nr:glycoside hydrolase family 116 protein [Acidobacteria bacterium AH-259-O06]
MRTYRAVRRGASEEWLDKLWPRLLKLIQHLFDEFDPDANGIIEGLQPNTYDRSAYGPNTFIGSLWLAALRAMEEMAKLQGDDSIARRCRQRFEKGMRAYDRVTWGEGHYIQIVDLEKHPRDNWGRGCLSDHLIGQWWAYMLDLGDILPPDHVHESAKSIMKNNFHPSLPSIAYARREFALDGEPGLLMCSWPRGGRPKEPVRYRDEVWTGVEYEVAGLLAYEGLVDEVWTGVEYEVAGLLAYEGLVEDALRIVRGVERRYDGRVRNPYNEIECGDHYVRAMSSWSVLEALSGFLYDHRSQSIRFGPRHWSGDQFRSFFTGGGAWGQYQQDKARNVQECRVLVKYGNLTLREFAVQSDTAKIGRVAADAAINGKTIAGSASASENSLIWEFPSPTSIKAGSELKIRFTSSGKNLG